MKKYIIIAAVVAAFTAVAYADVPCHNCKGSGSTSFNGQQIQCNWCRGSGRRAN